MKPIGLLVAIIFPYVLLFSATGSITGTVIDKITQEPLIGASVVLVGTELGAATDGDGNFVISGVEAGSYNIKMSMLGYKPIIKSRVIVKPGSRFILKSNSRKRRFNWVRL